MSSFKLGLFLGESWAELSAASSVNEDANSGSRWYLPRTSLLEGIKSHLQKLGLTGNQQPSQIFIASSRGHTTLRRRLGVSPALITTAGFESWLETNIKVQTPNFAWNPKRAWSPLQSDRIFGVSERASVTGAGTAEVNSSELEFLVSKLKLMDVKDVAICFVNSKLNPENENRAAAFFREHGLRATMSHEVLGESEIDRWLRCVEAAYVTPSIEEEKLEVAKLFKQLEFNEATLHWLPIGCPEELLRNPPTSTALSGDAAMGVSENDGDLYLYFGYEGFYCGWKAQAAEASSSNAFCWKKLTVQPTKSIEFTDWMIPSLVEEDRGYAPGPMAFGKSRQLTVFDLLFAADATDAADLPAEISVLLAEKVRSRILETLLAMGRMAPGVVGTSSFDGADLMNELSGALINKISLELNLAALECAPNAGRRPSTTWISGPFAPAMLKRLKGENPSRFAKCQIRDGWTLSRSCLQGAFAQ